MAKMRIGPRLGTTTATAVQGRMKLARLLEMPEADLEDLARQIETEPLFKGLTASGVVSLSEFPNARFAAKCFAGYGLKTSSGGLPELVDGNCDLAHLMQSVGQERFEEWFLGAEALTDEDRARGCGITVEEARKLREFLDRAFIQAEFETPAPAPEKVFSAVAGITLDGDKPVLAFFHREVWKKRYRVNKDKLAEYLRRMPPAEAGRIRNLLSRLKFVEQRKTTLFRLLEETLRLQAEYLRTGDPARRQPLTQRAMAASLDADPSVINRLISNKSVQMPWSLEAPLSTFFPSAKEINRERLYALACAKPGLTDDNLRIELERRHGVRLSRRSITQYRKELTLRGIGQRP